MVMKFDGDAIEFTDIAWAVVLDDSDGVEITLNCIDEEDALGMRHMFGGDIIARKIYYGEWHVVQVESDLSQT